MQVVWKKKDLSQDLGHGVEVYINLSTKRPQTVGFIDGYSWLQDTDPIVSVYMDSGLDQLPTSFKYELQLAILLFLTDKANQIGNAIIHGFHFGYNA